MINDIKPFVLTDDLLILWLYIQPGATHTVRQGLYQGRIKLKVAAPPIEGKANTILIAWLAVQFGVSKKAVELIQGDTTRYKKVLIYKPKKFPSDWSW
ncbi:MAG: DUF167 family protein [Pseudomonadota bacterium]